MFKGYCFNKEGQYTPAVNLENEKEAFEYVSLQKKLHHRVIAVDKEDSIVIEAKEGKIVFPIKEI